MYFVTKDNIKQILQAGESNTVEFKTRVATNNILPRIISAFANTEGGVIIIGYDERQQSVFGASQVDFEKAEKIISANNLEDVCSTYTIQFDGKTLIVIQVEKSKSLIIAGGGAYIRKGDSNISLLTSQDVVKRIESHVESSTSTDSKEVLERVEKKLEQVYDELLRSQKVHEEELKEQKAEHEKELADSKRSNWFFCILSAVIGAVLGTILGLYYPT